MRERQYLVVRACLWFSTHVGMLTTTSPQTKGTMKRRVKLQQDAIYAVYALLRTSILGSADTISD